MQLPDLQAFVIVAQERSFSVAARKLHRTQPAVSQAIKRLEEELGDRLFDRSSRDGTLTEAGRLLQDYAGRLFAISFLSIPSFFIAILSIVFLGRWFGWIPPRGYVWVPGHWETHASGNQWVDGYWRQN